MEPASQGAPALIVPFLPSRWKPRTPIDRRTAAVTRIRGVRYSLSAWACMLNAEVMTPLLIFGRQARPLNGICSTFRLKRAGERA